ncbi:serine/threonine protein phosphatase [Methanosarcina sp. 2.H.T.1A.6]|uniref:metallophosphoesterase family protein n=1 Tax=unclassified Methanosarcina TaxID=2644672 RepID=UPI000621DAF5|nr:MULTISPECIES: metallophosphoesterase family protein [unclassified Methanosarcina]KKG13245.1 serine/threonine protein phosphatase [Methanosarcina sp. 2.H.T.1A.15]KKG15420.1 serine/threonine protein phosphatase [Methanosarcina sp. 2.H.T.1A.3]KKG24769.1 serine/threonine protein phosphatase [Methanosarcina sp. 2.H.T.1A.6]KKG26114.1 serine/threonine protein phosphatase [Methanosarcina sp. 2.H.T.1A.8]
MKILLIADIHANLEALRTVLDVPHDRAICLGDIVDYGPDPDKCIDLLQKKNIPTIRGNHDNAVAFKMDCQCGYKYKHLSIATREYTWGVLDDSRMEYLQKLPLVIKEEINGKKLFLTHASPRSMFEYIKPETPDEDILAMIADPMEPVDAEFLVVGHSHIPMSRKLEDLTIINPGSVGQPRDGDTRAGCAVFDTETGDVEFFRLEYDIDAVCAKIEERMPYAEELTGILKRGY